MKQLLRLLLLLTLVAGMAHQSGAQSLVIDGNQIVSGFGPGQTRPPFAYGYLNADGVIVSGSANVNSVIKNAENGVFLISISGYADNDIVLVTNTDPSRFSVITAFPSLVNEELIIQMATVPDLEPLTHRVSFAVYKP